MKKIVYLLLFLCFAVGSPALALDSTVYVSPAPLGLFSTSSTDTPGFNEYYIGFGMERAENPDYYRYTLSVAYGVSEKLELGLNLPYIKDELNSPEDMRLALKYRVFGKGRNAFSGGYMFTISPSWESDDYSAGGSYGSAILATKRLGPFKGLANLHFRKYWDQDFDDELRFMAGFIFSASRELDVLAEYYSIKRQSDDTPFLSEARFGYRFSSDHDLYASVGVGVGLNEPSPSYRLLGSLSYILPNDGIKYLDEE
ncbi:hypothetical protein ACFLZI_02285 [Nitrospirota bacterium]